MGERDAFGREKGEDSLAGMGWKPSGGATVTPGDPPAEPEPAPAPRPEPAVFDAGEAVAPFSRPKPRPAAEPPPPRPPTPTFSRRPRRRGPSLARLIFLVAFLGVLAIGAASVVRVGGNAVDGIRDRIKEVEPQTATPSPAESLLRATPLRDALTKLPPGKLVFVRIAAGSVDAQVIRGGTRDTVHMSTTGPNAEVTTPAGAAQKGFKLDPRAPSRAIRTASRRAGLSVSDLDFIVGTEQGWLLSFKTGARYRANLAGRDVTKL